MTNRKLTRQQRINYDVAVRKGMTPEEARRHALSLTAEANRSISAAAESRRAAETTRPRCTCGALDFGGCLCGISGRDFLATPTRGGFARRL